MSFDGNGVFTRLYNWVSDRNSGVKIRADRMDAEFDGVKDALSLTFLRDGRAKATGDFDLDAHKLRGVAAAVLGSDAPRYDQVAPADATTAAFAALTWTSGRQFPYFTGADTLALGSLTTSALTALAALTAAGAALLDDADAAAQRTTLGLGSAAVESVGASGHALAFLDGANTWSNTQSIIPSAGLNRGVEIEQTFAGSVSVPPWAGNRIMIAADDVDGGAGFVGALFVEHRFGGAAMKGGRNSLEVFALRTAATHASNSNRNYVGGAFSSHAYDDDGGTAMAPKGAHFGVGGVAWAFSGATYLANVTWAEVNVAVETGASANYVSGIQIAAMPTHAVQGLTYDCMIGLSDQAGAVGWKDGLLWGPMNGQFPVYSGGTLLRTINGSVAHGIDFSTTTFSGHALITPGFAVTNTGSLAMGSAGANIEIGLPGTASTVFFDAHTSANSNDYDARLIFSGGAAAAGQGAATFLSSFLGVEWAEDGAAVGPEIRVFRNSASPAASDVLGKYSFFGRDSAGNTQEYANAFATIDDATSGSEDATYRVQIAIAGAMTSVLTLGGGVLNTTLTARMLAGNATAPGISFSGDGGLGIYRIGAGNLGIAAASTKIVDVDSTRVLLTTPFVTPTKTPASAGASGIAGEWAWDANYLYMATATNTWKRAAIATW